MFIAVLYLLINTLFLYATTAKSSNVSAQEALFFTIEGKEHEAFEDSFQPAVLIFAGGTFKFETLRGGQEFLYLGDCRYPGIVYLRCHGYRLWT